MVGNAMPSTTHELLVQVLREQPKVILELLRGVLGEAAEAPYQLLPIPATLADLEPAEFRADLVLHGAGPVGQTPERAIVVEVQLHVDDDKRFSWPFYLVGLRARLRCRVLLVVLTLDDAVARWAARPIDLDGRASSVSAVVLGPTDVPAVTDATMARALPELAVVSVLAHAERPDAARVGRALLEACRDLDDVRARLYTDVVFAFLNDAARRAIEADMQIDKYEYQSEFARRFLAQGREEGREEGRLEALAAAILEVLAVRGLAVDDAARSRIAACRDVTQLHVWLAAAVTVDGVERLLG
jgi:hypothetical protein